MLYYLFFVKNSKKHLNFLQSGNFPLIVASEKGHTHVVKFLLKGAEVDKTNRVICTNWMLFFKISLILGRINSISRSPKNRNHRLVTSKRS